MTPLLENAVLVTDLDAAGFNLLNLGGLDPLPANIVLDTDPRLTDDRSPLPGSVTDASVAPLAGIVQSKLTLDGVIPVAWLGTTSTTAAQGDLAEYLANKNQPSGYCGLDAGAKILAAQLPGTAGTGTITSIGLTMPAEFSVAGSPVTTAGTLAVTWAAVADGAWLGNKSGAPAAPQFYTTALPASLIPNLDAAFVVSGVFGAALLPTAIGLGVSHAPGAVPDPGDGSGGALATDYLARDMSYQPIPDFNISYQPDVDDPVLSPSADGPTGPKTVAFSDVVTGATIFYSLTSGSADFVEVPSTGYISLAASATVWSYAARSGYNNSNVVSYTNPNT